MTLALTDQHFGWHAGLQGADPASRVGTLALFDGDALDTAVVVTATTLDDVIQEIAAARVTERGTRADDKRSEAAMEDRKKQGYF
jgi:3'-phosphoadenosine 5'-phosphosulfate sulfotransferase (PAPS reductase)/FAD synthetase